MIWCRTSTATPRKPAHPEPAEQAALSVTLGNGLEDRAVNAQWRSGDIDAQLSISVSDLRRMLATAEAYKPGATLSKPNAA